MHMDKLCSDAVQEIKHPTRKSKPEVRVQYTPPVEATPPIEVKSKSLHGNAKGSLKATPPDHGPLGGATKPVINGATSKEPTPTVEPPQGEVKACKVRSKVVSKEKVTSTTRVSNKLTNEYVQLEEEAYKV